MEPQLNLSSFDWKLLPQNPFLLKFTISESGYCVVLTDLVSLFGESLKVDDVQQRFHELNPFADVRPEKIMKNIEQGLIEFSTSQDRHNLTSENEQHKLILDYSSNLVGLKYEVRLMQLPHHKMTDFILGPIIKCAALCERKIKELEITKGKKSTSVSGTSSCNSEKSLIHSSFLEVENSSNPANKKHQLMNTFADLQNFFNQLSLENIVSSNSLDRETTQNVKVRKLNAKKAVSGPVKYEEENNSLQTTSDVKQACEIDKKPNLKRPKKKILNL